jgi:hypothetical protein
MTRGHHVPRVLPAVINIKPFQGPGPGMIVINKFDFFAENQVIIEPYVKKNDHAGTSNNKLPGVCITYLKNSQDTYSTDKPFHYLCRANEDGWNDRK